MSADRAASAPDAGPAVSVVIPVRDGERRLAQCLGALEAQADVTGFEVIVVDNASHDATAAVARAHPIVTRVLTEPRIGSYAARNAGVEVARGDVLAFTDVDCTPEPGWLAAGVSALRTGDVHLVGGAIAMTPSTQPTIWERYDRAVYLRQQDVVAQGWAVTANLFARRDVFDAIGRFDATLLSGGDREWCLRATRHGFHIAYAEDAIVRHMPRTTAAEIWQLHRRVGAGLAALHRRGDVPPWWRAREHWMRLDWVIELMSRDGTPRLRRRQVLPVHGLAMAGRLYGRLRGS